MQYEHLSFNSSSIDFRLHLQHRIITKAYEDRLILAPVIFKSGDRVLETATGSGKFYLLVVSILLKLSF